MLGPAVSCYSCGKSRPQHLLCQCRRCGECSCGIDGCDGHCRCDITLTYNFTPEHGMKFLSDGHDVMAFTKDEEGRYVSFDENFSAQFGARAGFRDVDLFGDAVGLQMRERDLVALETGDTVESVYVMHTPSGEQHLLSRKTRIDGRSGRFIVGYIMNITKYTKKAAVKAMLTLVLMSMLGPGAAGFLGKKWWRGIFRDTDTPDTLSLAVS